MEVKLNQAAKVYQNHKHDFKKDQQKRHNMMMQEFGSSNGPKSEMLPHLKYKYKMNEPFVGGDICSNQDSHQ